MAIKKSPTRANRQNQPHHPLDHSSDIPKREMLLDVAHRRIASQNARINTLDAKANFVLASATVLVGAGLASQLAIVGRVIDLFGLTFSRAVPLAILVGAYLLVVAMTYPAYRPRRYSNAPDLEPLIKVSGDVSLEEMQNSVLVALKIAIGDNEKALKSKALWTRWALNALVAECVVLGVILVFEAMQ